MSTVMGLLTACVVLLSFAGCEPGKQIGSTDPDAASDDATVSTDSGTDGDATCACDASSCGERICGRSACGFPCGECEPGEFCFSSGAVEGQCSVGVGPGTPCVDAFGDRAWEGDQGFRTCPTDATQQQRCTCTGGGADAWASCDSTCIEICVQVSPGITCGAPGCGTGDVCCIPVGATDTRTCATGSCALQQYTRECDGPEDCAAGEACCNNGDNVYTTTCRAAASCSPDAQYCHTSDDCGGSTPYCCPSSEVEDMRICSANGSPTCT